MRKQQAFAWVLAAVLLSTGTPVLAAGSTAPSSDYFGWLTGSDGKEYWYENGTKQGTTEDSKAVVYEGTKRGREIYDPDSNGWYWLDADADGAKAVGKEVFMPYVYQDELKWSDEEVRANANASDDGMQDYVYQIIKNHQAGNTDNYGKWVRYDNEGMMCKGWIIIEDDLATAYPKQAGNIYYYDHKTGLMAKGNIRIGGINYHFDETTGVLDKSYGLDVTMFGATPDDGTDDTAAFNKALAALSSYGTSTLNVPSGTFNINGGAYHGDGIQPLSGQTIQMADGAVLKEITTAGVQEYYLIRIKDKTNVTVKGGTIIGNRYDNPSGSGDGAKGIEIANASNITIENVKIQDCYGDGIYIVERDGGGGSNVHIRNCTISNSCRNNITVRAGNNIEIIGCTLQNANGNGPQAGIDIEPEEDSVSNVTIDGCTFKENNKNSVQVENHAGNAYSRLTGVVIRNCNADRAIYGHNVNNLRVINSTIQGKYYADETKSGEWPWFGTSLR